MSQRISDGSLIDFLRNGGIIYSGPVEDGRGGKIFFKNGAPVTTIRQDFYALGGYRVPGFGNGAFVRAKQLGILRKLARTTFEIGRPPTGIWGYCVWYGWKEPEHELV